MSMVNLMQASFKEVTFKTCKLLGLHFEHCHTFLMSFSFEGCNLKLASFYGLTLKNTSFKSCNLQEADFGEADFTGSKFMDCDLGQAVFENTNLEKVDLRTAFNFIIDPDNNRIKKAKFSNNSLAGLLTKYDIEIE